MMKFGKEDPSRQEKTERQEKIEREEVKKRDKSLTGEAEVSKKYLDTENLLGNAAYIPSVVSEVGKVGLTAAIAQNPLAIKGFIAQEAGQFLSRKAVVGAINDMGKSLRATAK